MKKIWLGVLAFGFLAAASGWAQTTADTPKKRVHTRPPYSGPMKSSGKKVKRPARPSGRKGSSQTKPAPAPSGHIEVR
jgi:hypothetical protein